MSTAQTEATRRLREQMDEAAAISRTYAEALVTLSIVDTGDSDPELASIIATLQDRLTAAKALRDGLRTALYGTVTK